MRLYLTKVPKEKVDSAALEVPAKKHDRQMIFQLLGRKDDTRDFFRDNSLVERFATLLRAHGLENGPETAVQNLYGDFRTCQDGEPGNAKLAALLGEAMDKAVERKDGASVAALCASGVDINERDGWGWARLDQALRSNLPDLDRVRLLCANGAKLELDGHYLQLRDHIRNGQTTLFQILVENGAIDKNEFNKLLFKVLKAPLGAREFMLRILLENGASPNGPDDNPHSVLEQAACLNDTHSVKLLLKYRANPDGAPRGNRPLAATFWHGNRLMMGHLSIAGASLAGLSTISLAMVQQAEEMMGLDEMTH
jgi:hypothetical protein